MLPIQPLVDSVYLRPGESIVSDSILQVSTVLGSCISATYFHEQSATGAIFHALLPKCPDPEKMGNTPQIWKYVDGSILALDRIFRSRGISPRELEVKVFGGANMFSQQGRNGYRTVSDQNVETATALLLQYGYRIKSSDLGGGYGRKLLFRPTTGEVWMKRLKRSPVSQGM